MSGSMTSEKEPVRAYRRGTPSRGAVRELSLSLSESRALLVLLAIMLLGAVLRFYGLGFQSPWSDELASWDFSNRETISQVIGGARSDVRQTPDTTPNSRMQGKAIDGYR